MNNSLMSIWDFLNLFKTKRMHFNAYVTHPEFSTLYVRKGYHSIERKVEETFDIARIEATNKGQGSFTKLIMDIKHQYPNLIIYVECVLEPERFGAKLIRMGFTEIRMGENYSYYMR